MGEVYKAIDTRLNRTVAIKVLPPQFTHDHEMKQRFDREAQTIAGLNHPNICTLFDVGREGDTDFLVMEYLEGETLAARIVRGALPLNDALKVAIALADALEKAHGQGVTHRDLKPGNVMLTEKGAKLLDFGLAKLKQAAVPAGSAPLSAVGVNTTVPGMIIGTMQYMAPEQLEGKEADARTDLFAFGAVLYEMVTGRKAFEGKSQPHLIAAIVSVQPDPISKPSRRYPCARLSRERAGQGSDERLQTATDPVSKLLWMPGWQGRRWFCRRATTPGARRRSSRSLPSRCLWRRCRARREGAGTADARPVNASRSTCRTCPWRRRSPSPGRPHGQYSGLRWRHGVFVRPLNKDVGTKLAGMEGAGRLFWSPDSQWIAFFADGGQEGRRGGWVGARHLRYAGSGRHLNAGGPTPRLEQGLQRVLAAGSKPSPIAAAAASAQRRANPIPARWPALPYPGDGVGDRERIYGRDSTDDDRRGPVQRVHAARYSLMGRREAFDAKV